MSGRPRLDAGHERVLTDVHERGERRVDGKQAADHDRVGARGDGLRDVARVFDAAIGDQRNARAARRLGALGDRRNLGHASACYGA